MRQVIVLDDGQRLVIEPSHTFRNVRLWIPGTGHTITIPLEHAGTAALSIQAAAADLVASDRATGTEG